MGAETFAAGQGPCPSRDADSNPVLQTKGTIPLPPNPSLPLPCLHLCCSSRRAPLYSQTSSSAFRTRIHAASSRGLPGPHLHPHPAPQHIPRAWSPAWSTEPGPLPSIHSPPPGTSLSVASSMEHRAWPSTSLGLTQKRPHVKQLENWQEEQHSTWRRNWSVETSGKKLT